MTKNIDNDLFKPLATELASAGRRIYKRGWSPATSSNYSVRIDQDSCAITVSGKHKGLLTEDDIMIVNLQGHPLTENKPSAETLLHTQLYRRDSEINAVLHTHSRAATVLTRFYKDEALPLTDYELLKAFEGVATHKLTIGLPIFENTQEIASLASEVDEWMTKYGKGIGYLIRGHGLYTWGSTLKDCERHLEALEFLLECELDTLKINGVQKE